MNSNLSKSVKIGSIVVVFALFSSFSKNAAPPTSNIHEAVKSKSVAANVTSNGKHSGFSVVMNLTNKTSTPINILVPAGTTYLPANEDEQTLIQLEDQLIVLSPNQSKTTNIAAFCMEASDRCPTASSGFKIAPTTNKKLTDLSAYIKGKSIAKTSFQDAVWAISDGHSVSNITAEDPATIAFRKHVATLTGQKDTWFTSPQNVQIDENGNFQLETQHIRGRLEFVCAKGAYVHQDIHKANGDVMFKSDKTMQARSGNVGYTFHIQVKGWEKGDYYINLHDGTNQLAKYDFKV